MALQAASAGVHQLGSQRQGGKKKKQGGGMFACCGGPAPGAKKEITSSTPSAAPATTKSFSSGPNNPASEAANKEQPAVVTPAAAAAAPTPPAAELPAGWEAVTSQSTGDTYYKHTATGETTWDVPSATTAATLGLVPSVSAPEVGGRACPLTASCRYAKF